MTEKLLPRPFCGGSPSKPYKIGGSDERNGYNFDMRIRCLDCGVAMDAGSQKNDGGWCTDTGQAETQVRAAWNSRK